jgi:hypothetical protein
MKLLFYPKRRIFTIIFRIIKYNFKMENVNKLNHYDGAEVIERFNIEKQAECTVLDNWLDVSGTLNEIEHYILDSACKDIILTGRDWNEEELKMNFVALIFFVAKLNVPKKIQLFYERRLNGKVEGIGISVIVDGMLATPTNANRPKMPYFFLQEFKRSLGDDHDPEGQMLAAMILAQELNKDGKPIYGCWLQGKFWNFTTLINKNYCVSRTYDASNMADTQQIVLILRKLKDLISNR